jgi:hypothetical protein
VAQRRHRPGGTPPGVLLVIGVLLLLAVVAFVLGGGVGR